MQNVPIKGLTPHESMRYVPAMRPQEYATLVADIKAHGIKVPIEVQGDVVLDGMHRLRAARELKFETVPVRWVKLVNGEAADHYVLASAIARRHLTDNQRIMMAARYAQEHPMPTGAAAHGKSDPLGVGVTAREASNPALAGAAKLMNVSVSGAKCGALLDSKDRSEGDRALRGEVKVRRALHDLQVEEDRAAIKTRVVPKGRYDVVSIDPPWEMEGKYNPDNWCGPPSYPTMTIEEIIGYHAKELEAHLLPDCILWFWTTNGHMRDAYQILGAWGFTPKTILTWVKNQAGLGVWLRGETEHCIMAVQGKPKIHLTNQSTALRANRREHSRKPEEFFAMVEGLCLSDRRLDVFPGAKRDGWTTLGPLRHEGPAVTTTEAGRRGANTYGDTPDV